LIVNLKFKRNLKARWLCFDKELNEKKMSQEQRLIKGEGGSKNKNKQTHAFKK